jgi:predicted amidophosphoribosyltransferase
MLKKVLATISTVIYFAVTSGIVVNMHYCMDRFDSAQLYATNAEVCSKCGMHTSDSNGCCHDEIKVVKLNENHNFSQFNHEVKSPEAATVHYNDFLSSLHIQPVQQNDFLNHSPPLLSQQDTYLQNCVFRI